MLFANDSSNQKIRPTKDKKAEGFCPSCKESLIQKCGNEKIWHWAHHSDKDCDSWYQPETEWHLGWKTLFPMEFIETPITKSGKKHRADMFNPVIPVTVEFQHSPLSVEEKIERETFYTNLIWVIHVNFDDDEKEVEFFRNECVEWISGKRKWVVTLMNGSVRYFLDDESSLLYEIRPYGRYKGKYYYDALLKSDFVKIFGWTGGNLK